MQGDGIGHGDQFHRHFGPNIGIGDHLCRSGRGKENRNKVIINRINISDTTDIFTASEWYALRPYGKIVCVF